MKLFVDKVSSYEGVETPKGVNVDVEREEEKGVDDPIEFDAKAFMENINDLLSEFLISVNSLSISEYITSYQF